MSNLATKEIAERTSFYKLFKESALGVKIPIIQRDYAQGRPTKKELREGFLNALHAYLDEGKPNRDLDFVYGSITDGETKNFTPLDGQQRLTTLFLLHWYLAVRSDNTDNFKEVMLQNNQSRFTYETRTSSKEFCDALINSEIDLDDLLESDEGANNSLSKTLKNKVWYFSSWSYDLTIQSMLVMIDAIHDKFNNYPHFYDKLVDVENPIITFLFLNLQKFSLTDDLYLKMNARGKPLTDFENFKAKFEQYIEEVNWSNEQYELVLHNDLTRQVSVKEYFAHNIDTKWADFFWKYRNKKQNSFDTEILNFIRLIFTYQYALKTNSEKDIDPLEFLIGSAIAKKRNDYTDKFTFSIFKNLNSISKEAVVNLISILDVLSKKQSTITELSFFKEGEILKAIFKNEVSIKQRIIFYAYVEFLKQTNYNTQTLDEWMRVVYNLVENRDFDSSADFAKGLKEIESLLTESNDILNYLKSSSLKISFFVGVQVLEEQIKAHLITKNTIWKAILKEAEQHNYFRGQIGFLLEFSGIIEYFESHNSCDWSDEEDIVFYEKFNFYKQRAMTVFSFFNSKENTKYKIELAVLSKGDYLVNASSNRRNFLSTSKNMRDFSWKRLLRYNSVEYVKKRNYLKELFDDGLFDVDNLEKSLSTISSNALLSDTTLGWRKYFINTPKLLDYCGQGFININGDNIMLYNASQRNHKHKEMIVHHYFLNNIEQIDKTPFTVVYSSQEKGDAYNSSIVFEGYNLKGKEYQLVIVFINDKVKISFSNLEQIQFKYPPNISDVFRTNLFELNIIDDFHKWERTIDLKELVSNLKIICSQLPNK